MGTYNSAVITNGGQSMIAQAVAGASLEFTTIKTSSYAYPAGTNLAALTTINSIKQTKDITGATVYNSRVIKVSAAVDNTGLSTAYAINTIGIYAKVGSAAETLFAVVTASAADTMPAYSNKPYSYIYEVNLTMQNAANVTVTVNSAGLVNVSDLNAAKVEIRGEIADLKSNFNYINERFDFSKTPAADGYAEAVFFSEITRQYINGSGAIVPDQANGLSNLVSVDKESDAIHTTIDLSVYKIAVCLYNNGAWVRRTPWYLTQPTNNIIVLKDLSGDFDAVRVEYNYRVSRRLTAADDNEFINNVTVRRGEDTFVADYSKIKEDSIKYYSAIDGISSISNRLLANITENVVLNGSPSYWDDTPTGQGGSFINIRYTSNYNEQFFIVSVTGDKYERVVSRSGTIYRDWTLDTRSRFIKKKVYCTGDSIMWGRTDADGRASVTIPQNIASRYPVTVTNAAVGGDCIAHRQDGASVYDRITQVDLSTYDYVVINGGTNDYGFGTQLGTIDGTDVSTFCGAYKAIIAYILGQNPYMRIMLITPTFRNYVAQSGSWHYGNSYSMQGDGGYTMDQMCDAIIEIGKKYNIPVYDSRKGSPINEANYTTTLELTSGATDRYLHPSDKSYKLYGDSISSFFGVVF